MCMPAKTDLLRALAGETAAWECAFKTDPAAPVSHFGRSQLPMAMFTNCLSSSIGTMLKRSVWFAPSPLVFEK